MSMELKVGVGIWIPCKVKGGPFSDERRVLIESPDPEDSWFGFVNVRYLKYKMAEGPDEVLGKVVDIRDSSFEAIIQEHLQRASDSQAAWPRPFTVILSKHQILQRLHSDAPDRISISPRPEDSRVEQVSLNLRLGESSLLSTSQRTT